MEIGLTRAGRKDKISTSVLIEEAAEMTMDYREGCKRMLDKIKDERVLKKIYGIIALYYAKA